MLSDVADVNDWTALIVNAVWRDRTERVTRHVERDRRQHTEALLQEQSSSSAVFLDCHAPHKCQSYLSFSNDKSYWFIQENVVHNCTVGEISAGLKLSADNPAERIPVLMRLSLTFVFLKYLSDKSSISACGRLPASVPIIGGSSAKYCPPYRALLHRQVDPAALR